MGDPGCKETSVERTLQNSAPVCFLLLLTFEHDDPLA